MMRVVSDASVLIHLGRIGYFRLLKDLYGEVVIATGVYSEVVERGWVFQDPSKQKKLKERAG